MARVTLGNNGLSQHESMTGAQSYNTVALTRVIIHRLLGLNDNQFTAKSTDGLSVGQLVYKIQVNFVIELMIEMLKI